MIYVAVFFACMIATVLFLAFLDLHPCGATYGNLVRCRALVGRRGHRHHVWEPVPLEEPVRAWVEDLHWRNRVALMAEERIGLSVMNPKAVVLGTFTS